VNLEVRGPTLTLRYATPADAPALFVLGADEDVTRWFSWGPYTAEAEPRAYIDSLAARREAGVLLDFLIVHREHGAIGVTGLSELSARNRHATVGTWFGREWWGTGVNAESKALIGALAFDRLGMERLTAWANARNGRSQAALERVGYRREGVLRSWHRHGETMHDVVVFRMLREEFERSALRAVPAAIEGDPPAAFVVSRASPPS
jgi:ribosomal-protein-alanine N-acetyltransferase